MDKTLHITSEVGRLRTVMVHRPGEELLNLSPSNLDRLLFDDIPFLAQAQVEHDAFARILRDEGVEVLYLEDLVAETLDAAPEARDELITAYVDESGRLGASLQDSVHERLAAVEDSRELVRMMVCGVRSSEVEAQLGDTATLADLTALAHGRGEHLIVDPMPNLYFTRDPFSVIGNGVSVNRMHTPTRRRETLLGEFVLDYHPAFSDVPRWYGRGEAPHIEGGDILVLSGDAIAVGVSERTEASAVDALAARLLWAPNERFKRVLAFVIPHARAFMHLDTVLTQVDVDTFSVHPNILETIEVYELTRGSGRDSVDVRLLATSLDVALAEALGVPSVRLIRCGGGDPIAAAREQWNDGANTLAVRPGRVLVYQRNVVTNDILYRAGLELLEVPSSELSRGRGGPHCMSMAFVRDEI